MLSKEYIAEVLFARLRDTDFLLPRRTFSLLFLYLLGLFGTIYRMVRNKSYYVLNTRAATKYPRYSQKYALMKQYVVIM